MIEPQIAEQSIQAIKLLKIQKENKKLTIQSPYYKHKWRLGKKYKTEMAKTKNGPYSGFHAYINIYNPDDSIAEIAEYIYQREYTFVYGVVVIPKGSEFIIDPYKNRIISNQMILKHLCISELAAVPEISEKDLFAILKQAVKFAQIIKETKLKYFMV